MVSKVLPIFLPPKIIKTVHEIQPTFADDPNKRQLMRITFHSSSTKPIIRKIHKAATQELITPKDRQHQR